MGSDRILNSLYIALTSNSDSSMLRKHAITKYYEAAYSVIVDGTAYYLLASSLLSFGNTANVIRKMLAAEDAEPITYDMLFNSYYTDDSVSCSFGTFEGIGFLIDCKNEIVSPVTDDAMLQSLMHVFFSAGNRPASSLTEQLTLNELVRMDGTLAFNTEQADTAVNKMLAMGFSFGDRGAVNSDSHGKMDAYTLYYNRKVLTNACLQYWATAAGLLVCDVDYNYLWISYNPLSVQRMNHISFNQNAPIQVFIHGSFLYYFNGIDFVKVNADARFAEQGNSSLRLSDGREILFTTSVPDGLSFHVSDYKLCDEYGNEVVWNGQKWSLQMINQAGLDTDTADTVSNMPQKITLDGDTENDSTDSNLQKKSDMVKEITELEDNRVSTIAAGLEKTSNSIVGLETTFRTPEVDKLYEILMDRSLVF